MLEFDLKQRPSKQWIEDIRQRFEVERLVDRALTRKLYQRAGPPHKPQSQEAVTARLNSFFGRRIPEGFDVSEIHALSGGSSKEQFRFRLRWRDLRLGAQDKTFVLRLQPAESVVETHRQREFEVIRELRGVIPVPEASWCDPEGEEFGQPALITSFEPGIVKPPAEGIGEVTGPKQGFGPRYRKLLGPQLLQIIAGFHTFDWAKADLPSLDVPEAGTNQAVLWAINWWKRVWEEDCLEPVPLLTYVAQWLTANAPPVDTLSIVHGDFRGGNFLFRAEDGKITAMLDWELTHLGDRHEDLTYIINPLFSEPDENGRALAGGFWPRDEFLREYERVSGLSVDPKRLEYYRVLNAWRMSIQMMSTAIRCALGQKTHQDILLGWIAAGGFIAAQELYDVLNKRV